MKAYFYKRWVDGSGEARKPCTGPSGEMLLPGPGRAGVISGYRGNQGSQRVSNTVCAALGHFRGV